MTPSPVIVRGASGIGAAVAAAYRAHGTTPLVWDIAGSPDIECDIRDEGAVAHAVGRTVELVGVPEE